MGYPDSNSFELFSIEQLKCHAAELAENHRLSAKTAPDQLLSRLARNERHLRASYTIVSEATAHPDQASTQAENWLLDNFYLIEQQIALVRRHLPPGYSRRLPCLASDGEISVPRVYDIAIELTSHTDGRIDADNTNAFIQAYQSVTPLLLGELWAVPIMLQLALLENLRFTADKVARQRQQHDSASQWAERLIETATEHPSRLPRLLAEFAETNIKISTPFIEQLNSGLAAHGTILHFIKAWIDHRLAENEQNATTLAEFDSHQIATNQLSIANSIGSLRFVNSMEWKRFVETCSVVEKMLHTDPDGTYSGQDFATRDRYRHAVEHFARYSACSEIEVVRAAVELARKAAREQSEQPRRAHVGYYLVNRGRKELMSALGCSPSLRLLAVRANPRLRLVAYTGTIALFTLSIALVLLGVFNGSATGTIGFWSIAATGLIAGSSTAVALVNLLVTVLLPPRTLSRLDFSAGIPDAHRTVIVIPTLLTSNWDVDHLLENLEVRYLGNRDSNLFFALLTDFGDASESVMPEDQELLARMLRGIRKLNARYASDRSGVFYLLHRPRSWNSYDQLWSGYERKRGKLEQFNALLRGGSTEPFTLIEGDVQRLQCVRYVITLDTDTQLPRGAARQMVGYMAHPLNRPVFHPEAGRVIEGFGILQPRTTISLVSANQSLFSRLYAGDSGIDPYTREVSDVYQDLFAEGSFVGKGIYDVDAFRKATEGRFPENLILSHDLIESGHARSALISEVDLVEEHPASYTADASRRHRWMRGDWQLVGWLLPRSPGPGAPGSPRQPNPLSAITRWKLLDNIRRSLIAPALLGFLLGGWLLGAAPEWLWSVLLVLLVLLPAIVNALIAALRKPRLANWLLHLRLVWQTSTRPLLQAALTIIFLPYEAALSLDAMRYSALRLPFTRRGLLRWQLPRYARRNRCLTPTDFFREMWVGPALGLAGIAFLLVHAAAGEMQWIGAMPVLLAWLVSPLAGWWISRPRDTRDMELSAAQRRFLRRTARRTWHYFDTYTTADDNWLIPDNVQVQPDVRVARRTSPTNIGMSLLANLSALDMGYIHAGDLLRLTQNTFSTLSRLPRYRGHFYNWYATDTLEILPPSYVSTVDSGNLAGCLLTLQQGLGELLTRPILPENLCAGLDDTLGLCAESLGETSDESVRSALTALQQVLLEQQRATPAPGPGMLQHMLRELMRLADSLSNALTDIDDIGEQQKQLAIDWLEHFVRQCQRMHQELISLLRDPGKLAILPSLESLQSTPHATAEAVQRAELIEQLRQQCGQFMDMDFRFLYEPSSDLLSIGYNVGERRLDPACYDLLASEARLASFLLIAWDQVPQTHWFTLGRLLTSTEGAVSLVSWSGSMFEYLMPQLLMPEFENTLLHRACRAAVKRQIDYCRKHGIPWGISESCYNTTDASQTYQYRAFGVPGLGLKRGLADDLVIAPYASALALTVSRHSACRNLEALAAAGFLGEYGFYEAIDYTPSRVPRGQAYAVVRSFMAHHQGMSLLGFVHTLLNQPMQRRFTTDPRVRATELLLHERVPRSSISVQPHMAEVGAMALPQRTEVQSLMRIYTRADTLWPEVHLLSNGRYHLMVTQAGSGYSHWDDLALTRWREDIAHDNHGTFVYLRDEDSGEYWSSAHQPVGGKTEGYEAVFLPDRAEFRRQDHNIRTHTELCVSAEHDVEIRRVTLTNQSAQTRHIEVTTYAEIVLAPLNADLAHPLFNKLFISSEILSEQSTILFTRRARQADETPRWMFHMLAVPRAVSEGPSCETDRMRFIGRGRSTANPIALEHGVGRLSNTDGCVLDPIAAIRRLLVIDGDGSASVQIITGVADSREAALKMIEHYSDHYVVERAFKLAWFRSQEVLPQLDINQSEAQLYGQLASSVVFCHKRHRAPEETLVRNTLGQSSLWRFAISGDLPIVLLCIGNIKRLGLLQQILKAHAFWRMKGLQTDLVIINEDFSGYRARLHDEIIGLIHAIPETWQLERPGGVFVRRAEEISESERVLLETVARIVINDNVESLATLLNRKLAAMRLPGKIVPGPVRESESHLPLPRPSLHFDNGTGGFSNDGREYVIYLTPEKRTPVPWVNVIASPHIGTVISESGSAYTWVENAHELRLTPWNNDPVSDSTGEAYYLRDEDSGQFWSPTSLPAPSPTTTICRHGFGYSIFEQHCNGIKSELTVFVAMDVPVKLGLFKLYNDSTRARRLSLTAYHELVLGEWRHKQAMHTVTERDATSGALFARNTYNQLFADRVCFCATSEPDFTVTGSRLEFIGRNGTLADPAALSRTALSDRTGAAHDPCAAIQAQFELAPGQTREVVVILGAARNSTDAGQLVKDFSRPDQARAALQEVNDYWHHTLGAVRVTTPDLALDILANGWLLYQTLSCRLWGRSGFYQSGGAYGFRDQLQDSLALIHAEPVLVRKQLLRCASRQFGKGDVQHWWHPPHGHGVRTHFSDDYLWLPWVCCQYVHATGDWQILDAMVPFLEGRELHPDEEASYGQPQRSTEHASLYEHCVRAIRYGLRFGEHNLPLMGCGDWNDGMNRVGIKGKGESVWLGWFLLDTLQRFAMLAESRDDESFAVLCREQAQALQQNIEASAWDGSWYRRAWFDDGTPLGSAQNEECQIDAISQSWAALSGAGQPERIASAMDAVYQRLVRHDASLVQLLTPPFDKSALDPGYIKGYPPGVRENGGQYTHAAIWTTMAYAQIGQAERAWTLYSLLNPIYHGDSAEAIEIYKVEPYVIAADVYSSAPHTGRGGWTWYTGAAGWMYRLLTETLLGLQREGDRLRVIPCVPAHWDSYSIDYRYGETQYAITLQRNEQCSSGVYRIVLDGSKLSPTDEYSANSFPLLDDGKAHEVVVEFGS